MDTARRRRGTGKFRRRSEAGDRARSRGGTGDDVRIDAELAVIVRAPAVREEVRGRAGVLRAGGGGADVRQSHSDVGLAWRPELSGRVEPPAAQGLVLGDGAGVAGAA